jgi:NADH:ubiquinone oxidoreductase subunit 3 (subunit A)
MNMMIVESLVAFLIIFVVSVLIYLFSRRVALKAPPSEVRNEMYACGEKVASTKLLVNVNLYKYLIYFVIIDSPALIAAFAAFALVMINPFHLLIYLGLILAADFLLLGGIEDA